MTVHVPAWARRGTEVVCICDDWDDLPPAIAPVRLPMLNEVLTLDAITARDEGIALGPILFAPGVFVTFVEIAPQYVIKTDLGEVTASCWWNLNCFRPLIRNKRSRRADVALFNSAPTKIREDA